MALRYFKLLPTRVPIKPLSSYRFLSTLPEQQRQKQIQQELETKIITMETNIKILEETIKNLNSTKEIKTPHFKYRKTEPIKNIKIEPIEGIIPDGLDNFLVFVMVVIIGSFLFIALLVFAYGLLGLSMRILEYIFH
jgi:hypothetical protein